MKKLTPLAEHFYELIGDVAGGQRLGRVGAGGRIMALPPLDGGGHDDGLHAGLPPGADFGDEVGDAVGIGEGLGLLHDEAGHGDAAAGAQVSRGLVGAGKTDQAARADDILVGGGPVIVFVSILSQFGLELADLFLKLDDVVAANLAALGRVVVFAYGPGSLTGQAAGKGGIASGFSLKNTL